MEKHVRNTREILSNVKEIHCQKKGPGTSALDCHSLYVEAKVSRATWEYFDIPLPETCR